MQRPRKNVFRSSLKGSCLAISVGEPTTALLKTQGRVKTTIPPSANIVLPPTHTEHPWACRVSALRLVSFLEYFLFLPASFPAHQSTPVRRPVREKQTRTRGLMEWRARDWSLESSPWKTRTWEWE